MGLGLLGGDPALVDEHLHERVVVGDRLELVVAQHIAARVADMGESEAVAGRAQNSGDGGAHSGEFGLFTDTTADAVIGFEDRGAEEFEGVLASGFAVEFGQAGHGDRRGDVPAGVTAHSVGDEQEIGSRIAGVLVVLTHQPGVRPGCRTESDGTAGRHDWVSRVVCPMVIRVPIASWMGPVMREPSTMVPFVDPRSSSIQAPFFAEIRA